MGNETKLCKGPCEEVKPRDEFYGNKDHLDGLDHQCKECRKEYQRSRNKIISEHNKAYQKEYRKKNKEILEEKARRHREANRGHLKEREKAYRQSPKGRKVIDKYLSQEKVKLRRKKYLREWQLNNKDRVNEHARRRTALKNQLQTEELDYTTIRKRDTSCYLCGKPFSKQEQFDISFTEIDHKIPLSRLELSPSHSYENCALVHQSCNRRKHNKTADEFWGIYGFPE